MMYLAVALVSLFSGFGIGYMVSGLINKCNHEFEKTVDTINSTGSGTVVYMCKKCGKQKITKV